MRSSEIVLEKCYVCGYCRELFKEGRKNNEDLCPCCQTDLGRHSLASNKIAFLFSFVALVLYLPANIYPVATMTYMGRVTENTIWSGVLSLYKDQKWMIATLVFLVSIIIPLVKIFANFFILFNLNAKKIVSSKIVAKTYRFIKVIGPWSMLDVFLVSIFVALIKLEDMATVAAGPGIVPFAGVVVLTLLSTSYLDLEKLWSAKNEKK